MKTPDVSKMFNVAKRAVVKHSPEILTGIGITGMITTTVLAVKATPKALKKIEEKKIEVFESLDPIDTPSQAVPEDLILTKREIIKATWKCYVPAAVTGVVSAACIIGANKVNSARNTALVTAYNLSQQALHEYKEQIAETVGEEAAAEIKQKADHRIAEKQVASKQPETSTEAKVFLTGMGDELCLDSTSQRYFRSSKNALLAAQNKLNAKMLAHDYVSLSDWYDLIGLNHTSISDDVGWSIGRDGMLDIDFTCIDTENGEMCRVINYSKEAVWDYWKVN